MMQNEAQNYDEMEIDLSKYVEVLFKRKKTFLAVFLLILAMGFFYILLTPKIYKISTLLQPPVSGESLTGANDLVSNENLKGLIVNNAFNEKIIKRMNLDSDKMDLEFDVVIPKETNILRVGIDCADCQSRKKEFGIIVLQNLIDVISETYGKRVEVKNSEIVNQIKQKEHAISNAKEKAENLKDQIKETINRESKLAEEIKNINANTEQILSSREDLLKEGNILDSTSVLLLTNFIQNNLSYSNQLNNQFSTLSIRKANLELEIKEIDSKISDFQMAIDELNANKVFVSNLKVLSPPKVSRNPISPNKKKILALVIFMGFFFSVFAVFAQEFWQQNIKGKINK
ncbi:MAG: Wzz/FepE/Etk N-terminal domain-containing protein [Candidatus Aceula meridiana]|nr:Wzz/FepE/Etk N-terminal domain-containing protein [Candidatus Aceula meridiana]